MTTHNAELVREMRDAAEALLKRYIGLVESGDAGNWDPFSESEVADLSYAIQAYDLHAGRRTDGRTHNDGEES